MRPVAVPSPTAGRRGALPLLFVLVLLGAWSSGCASRARDLALVRDALYRGDVETALTEFDKVGGKDSDLLHLLEKGYLLHVAGRWEESNAAFEAAEARAEDLYTRSVSREAAALLTSDNALPYRGHAYELQMLQYYRALNYLELGSLDGALVEARKANYLADRVYAAGDEEEAAATHPNAFLDYFTGLLYARAGEWNDATVAFRRAYESYAARKDRFGVELPGSLTSDFYQALLRTGQAEEAARLEESHDIAPPHEIAPPPPGDDTRRLVVFFESGFVPHRESVDITLPIFEEGEGDAWNRAGLYVDRYGPDLYTYGGGAELDHVLRFAFPRLERIPSPVARGEIEVPGGAARRSVPVLDLSSIAEAEFADRLPKILLKTVARALLKEAQRKAAKKENEVLGWVVNAINVATEQADTRSWILLPGRVEVVDLLVPADVEEVRARFVDRDGATVEEWTLDLGRSDARTEIVALRSFH